VWQLDPSEFTLKNPEWERHLADVVKTVQQELGLEKQKLESHLYNLLVYEPGSFFLPHRDGEKLDRMVATLVIVLPSSFQGGELVVRHEGEERTIDFSKDSAFQTHFAAFYADCEHEVRPLREGYRLCLVYNLTLAKSKKGIAAPRTAEHIEEIARVLRGWSEDDDQHKLVVPLEHQYTQDGLTWNTLKGVDRVKATVLHEAAKCADCQAHLALLTFWEASAVEETGGWGRRSRRGFHHDSDANDSDYEIIEAIESSLTLNHWSDADGTRPTFGEMKVDEEEVVPPNSLTKVKPEQDVSGYTGNEGLTMERWYRHSAIVLWPSAREVDVLCDCGVPAAVAALQERVAQWKKASKKDVAARSGCVEFARRILALCGSCGRDDANGLLASLVAIDETELFGVFLREIVLGNRLVEPGEELRGIFDRHGWVAFEKALSAVFTATTSETLERNVAFLEMLCTPTKKQGDEERVRVCGKLAEAVVSRLEVLDKAATATYDWRIRDVKRAQLLVTLTRSLLSLSALDLLSRLVSHSLADAKTYPLYEHIQALTALRPSLKKCEPVSRWIAAVREQLEALTAEEPQPPTDYRREANVSCKCAECGELKRFLLDPKELVHRFRAMQKQRSHLETCIRSFNCDVDCTTERKGSPHTLVCTKNTASFEAALKKYREDCEHLAAIRAIEKSVSG
jgi:hypothetical protein